MPLSRFSRRPLKSVATILVAAWLFCLLMSAHMSVQSLVPSDAGAASHHAAMGHQDAGHSVPADSASGDCCEIKTTALKAPSLADLVPDGPLVALVLVLSLWLSLTQRPLIRPDHSPPPVSGWPRRHLVFCNFRN